MHRVGVAIALLVTAAAACAQAAAARERLETGRRIYQAQCAACHGATAAGQPDWQRPNAAGELPAPPHDRSGHTWKHSDGMLHRIVAQGWRDPFNKTQRLTMPPFQQTLDSGDIQAVIEYLKTLWTPRQRAFQRAESRREPYPPTTDPRSHP